VALGVTLGLALALGLLAGPGGAAPPSSAPHAAHGTTPSGNRDPHGPADVEEHIRWLEGARRIEFQKPEAVVAALGLRPTDVVADLGCGPGLFTRLLARVLPRGLVYAVDVEPRQLYRLQEHIAADRLHNVIPVLASPSDPHLPPDAIDLILVVDTYHHFDERPAYLGVLARALRPSGRLVVIDYFKRELPVGPPVEHKIARDVVVREVTDAGYRLVDEPTMLPYQYFLVFTRPPVVPPAAP
jgi:ubiquinone/menaquinone biosynthesis C-methylase UbiE